MKYHNLLVEKQGHTTCLTINRPERRNAFDKGTVDEFLQAFTDFRDNEDEWVMIITGAGEQAFCAGADMKVPRAGKRLGDVWKPVADLMQEIMKPFIVAVNGACVGGGWHLVADGDIIICSENAQFMDTHVNVGFICGPEGIGLSRRMPLGVVMRMVMTGNSYRVSAQQAYQWGLVSEVVPLPQLMPTAWRIAEAIVENCAPLAVRGSKKAIMKGMNRGLHDAVAYGWTVLPEVWDTEDYAEGPRAFAEKRKPVWKGR